MVDRVAAQAARRRAVDRDSARRLRSSERDRTSAFLVEEVLKLVRSRDAVVGEFDALIGEAVRIMTREQGLSLREAVAACAGRVSLRDASRMRRFAEERARRREAGRPS